MAAFGQIQIGRLAFREDSSVGISPSSFGTSLDLSGQESMPRVTREALSIRRDDTIGLIGQMLPCQFSHKPELDGFYFVDSADCSYDVWMPENLGVMPWHMMLTRAGYASEIDVESRLSGPLTRVNDHSQTGERWHAPAVGHNAYWAGNSAPTIVTRTGSYGAQTVYRGIGLTTNPRWGSSVAGYLAGRCRIVDTNGFERSAASFNLTPNGWSIDNGLVKMSIDSTTGLFNISAWTGGAWQSKLWELFHSTGPAVSLGVPDYARVVRNDFEMITVRITRTLTPGRVTVDFSLRRGSRFLEIYVQHLFGTTLKLVRSAAEASMASTGYLTATAADGAGNKFVIGSAKSFTADNVGGGISKAATAVLDAFIGVQITGAPTGDTGLELFKQYLGTPSEMVQGVRR